MKKLPDGMREMSNVERIEILGWLRKARAQVLEDAEAFALAAAVVERVGQIVAGKFKNGLGGYEEELRWLSMQARGSGPDEFNRLFRSVKDARNDAVHEGAFARHMSSRLVDLILVLEDAVSSTMNAYEDLMVRNPITAKPWHLVGHLRNSMLASSFSFIPYHQRSGPDKGWRIISDRSVVELLQPWARTKSQLAEVRSLRIDDAIEQHKLVTSRAKCVKPNDVVSVADLGDHPILVTDCVDEEECVLGIITAFDLL